MTGKAGVVVALRPLMIVGVRRLTSKYAAGALAIPGGWIERGESPIDAALRELTEEVGTTIGSLARDYCWVEAEWVIDGQGEPATHVVELGCPPILTEAIRRLAGVDDRDHAFTQARVIDTTRDSTDLLELMESAHRPTALVAARMLVLHHGVRDA